MSSRRLNPDHERRFHRIVRELNRLRADVEAEGFDANWYMADDDLHLLDGPSHKSMGLREEAQGENSLVSERIVRASGGGW